MPNRLLCFVDALQSATTLEESVAALLAELERYGFTEAKYGFLPSGDPRFIDREILFAGSFQPEWEQTYLAENFVKDDYIVAHCLTSEQPIAFHDVYKRLGAGDFSGNRARLHTMSLDLGMHNGYAIPLRSEYPLSAGALSLVASNEFSGEAFISHLNDVGEDLRLIAEAFHTALRRPLLVEPEGRLTDRERECLLWSIQGLRAQQIAERIGTKTKTVEKQIASARQRLHARTNAQAAVKAILLGLIAP